MFALNAVRPMSRSLRVLAALLAYPEAQTREHLAEMRALLHDEQAVEPSRLRELDALIESVAASRPFGLATFTATFKTKLVFPMPGRAAMIERSPSCRPDVSVS